MPVSVIRGLYDETSMENKRMSKPKVFSAEELKERKLSRQRERRALAKASGIDIYAYKRMSPEELVAARKAHSDLMKAWFKTAEGMKSINDRAAKSRKYNSIEERRAAGNAQKNIKKSTNIPCAMRHRLQGCKNRAKRDGVSIDIDVEYLVSIYTDTCPYLGTKMSLMATSGNSMDAMSIDRIIPELGYVKGNVQVISYKANVMKQDVSLELLRTFAKSVLRLHGDNDLLSTPLERDDDRGRR
jgi:hypothetical protein